MLPCRTVKVADVIESGSIASLKVAVILLLMATPELSVAGLVELTWGGLVSAAAPVVKLQERSAARAAPCVDFAPVVRVAVKTLPAARGLEGAKVALMPSALVATTPGICVVPCFSVKVAALRGSIAMSKAAESVALSGTLVAPSTGDVERSVGEATGSSVPPQAERTSVSRTSPRRVARRRWTDGWRGLAVKGCMEARGDRGRSEALPIQGGS